MCTNEKGCRRPENKTCGEDKCTPDQIRICHGDVEGHPCENRGEKA